MAKTNRWLLPTNTINMRMIIAQGLIASPNGFKKYYTDVLDILPGYIPLFKNEIQTDILNYCISERDNLTPCIMEIDIKDITGKVNIINDDNELISIDIEDIDENINIIFVLAPLSFICIKQLLFASDTDKKQFIDDASNRSNVILGDLSLQSRSADKKVFQHQNSTLDDISIDRIKNIQIDLKEVDYKKVYSFGGMLFNLFYYGKNGYLSNNTFHTCASFNHTAMDDKDISLILNLFFNNNESSEIETTEKIYSNLIKVATNNKEFKESVIDFLLDDDKTKTFANRLQAFETKSEKPISEEFKEAKTNLGKLMLMVFLRDDTDSLIDYPAEIFNEKELLSFAILFGIRDGFMKVPAFIREFKGLQNFISLKMAQFVHSTILDSNIILKDIKQPMTMVDMLKKDRFKEYIAKELDISYCFNTSFSSKNYEVVNGKIIFKGILMPKFELLEDKYYKYISTFKLIDYNKYIKKYDQVK